MSKQAGGIRTREELREWLSAHGSVEPYCWVPCKRGKPPEDGTLWYVDAVEEAICFGWIDATLKRVGDVSCQKFMPRSKNSHWTELNKERARRMIKLGLMTDAGRAVLPDLDAPFEIRQDILDALQADVVAWENFQSFPQLYQRVRVDNIQGYRYRAADADEKIRKLVQTAHDGVMYGQWDDYGRLSE